MQSASPDQICALTIKNSTLWDKFPKVKLTENMRVAEARRTAADGGAEVMEFCDWLVALGEGRVDEVERKSAHVAVFNMPPVAVSTLFE